MPGLSLSIGLTQLKKAELVELEPDHQEKANGQKVTVQFNPETLRVTYANRVPRPATAASESQAQFAGESQHRLSLQLWFDTTAPMPPGGTAGSGLVNVSGSLPGRPGAATDVREHTRQVAYFMLPLPSPDPKTPPAPPKVRFRWGTFQFDGTLDSLEESLEFFSDEGVPLRASLTLGLSGQKPPEIVSPSGAPPGLSALGTTPLVQARAGASLQGLAASAGLGGNWRAVATANGIENPRLLTPGQMISLNVKVR